MSLTHHKAPMYGTCYTPVTRYNRLSIRLYNWFDNRLYRVNGALTRDHTVLPVTHTFIHKWNESCVPLLPGRRASPHFGRYSFSVRLRVRG